MRLMPAVSDRLALVVLFLVGVLLPILVGELPRGPLASVLAVLAASCWVLLPLVYPVVSLSRGYITSKGGITYRSRDPARFWIGLATYELLMCFVAVLALGLLRMYLIPAKP